MKFISVLLLIIVLNLHKLCSQSVIINEILASNVRDYPEMHDFDDYTDWIEIHNPSSQPFTFNENFITDDLGNPFKWKFPDGIVIESEGYLIIWADDYNDIPNQIYTRPYWPWDQFTTQNLHTNFKLNKTGEEIGLFQAEASENITLIEEEALWKYLDNGSNQESDWFEINFNDDDWSVGNAELGYGDGDETTVLDFGDDEDNKYITTYFRHTFICNNPENIQSLTIRLKRDDGAVIYLNGDEIIRNNMPLGLISYDTFASDYVSSDEEEVFLSWSLANDLLQNGENVIAVEIHQVSESSSDISFDLELTGTSYSNVVLLDSVTFPNQFSDVSYGRVDNEFGWSFFGEPTAGLPNNTLPVNTADISSMVEFSLEPGFYESPQTIELFSEDWTDPIYYTLDGTRPGSDDYVYVDPIPIANTTVLKARSIGVNKLPSEVVVSTYFISEQNYIPTISLSAEPETLWDEEIGIYENEYKQREIPITIEYFTPENNYQFTVNAGARLGGLNIWTKPQKPFTIYTRNRFGQDLIDYQLFKNKSIANFSRIVLRNGGDDWEETLIRDPMTESLVRGMMECGYMGYSPSALFLNGEYWGIHNIREKFDTQYFSENFNVNPDNLDHLEYTTTQNGTEMLVVEGTLDHYSTMIDYIMNNDLNNAAIYNEIQQRMNVDSFIDHIIMTIYCANTSWGHNREWWRPREENGTWQWLIVDLDRGFNINNSNTNLVDNLKEDYELFQYLLNSSLFVDRFVQRSAAHLSNTFFAERMNSIVDSLGSMINLEMPRHIDRWGNEGGIPSMNIWESELDEIKQFAENRSTIVQNQMMDELNMQGTVEVIVNVQPQGAGKILVNDVPIIHPEGEGTFFKNKPLHLTVFSKPGYQFVGWDGVSDSTTITYNCAMDTTFIAIFDISNEFILPEVIEENTTLTNAHPYVVTQDLLIPSDILLTIQEGVELRMFHGSNIHVEGQLLINGTEENPIQITSHNSIENNRWGAICFTNALDTSYISHTKISGASTGINPSVHHGAISSINSHIVISHIEIDDVVFPIYVEDGSISISESVLSCDYICDYINVKGGEALIENCTFFGSDAEDTDAIDLDNVNNGIVRNNRIYNFNGSNSDGIDIGESSEDILIVSNLIYHAWDKGISVGQSSSVTVDKNLVVGSNNGIAVKDNSSAYITNNTFFNNDTSISCFEKNEGAGGGSAEIINTIFSGNVSSSIYLDNLSSASVTYSLSDSELLQGEGNLFSDPRFLDQTIYNLELASNSPCLDSGSPNFPLDQDGTNSDIGAYYIYNSDDYPYEITYDFIDQLKINELLAGNNAINTDEAGEYDDWIELYNPTNQSLNLSGLFLVEGSDQWQFPDTTSTISPGDFLLIWCDDDESQGPLHTNFKLSMDGEEIKLLKSDGVTVIDSISFGPQTTDQSYGRIPDGNDEWGFMLPTPGFSNTDLSIFMNAHIPEDFHLFQNFPNPFNPSTAIRYALPKDNFVILKVIDLMGREVKTLVNSFQTKGNKSVVWNAINNQGLSVSAGVYFYSIESGEFISTKKMILIK